MCVGWGWGGVRALVCYLCVRACVNDYEVECVCDVESIRVNACNVRI